MEAVVHFLQLALFLSGVLYMRLLPLAALRRDREQFIYNWMLEDDLDLD